MIEIRQGSKLNLLVSILFLLSLLSMRPTWLGETYSTLSMLLIWIAAAIFYFFSSKGKYLGTLLQDNLKIFIPFILLDLIELFNSFMRGDNDFISVQGVVLDLLILSPSFYLLSHKELNKIVVKFFYFSILTLAISTIISFLLSTIVDSNSLVMLIYKHQRTYSGANIGVLFPFTPSLVQIGGADNLFGVSFYRTLNWFREPGIAQAFLSWAFVVTSKFFDSDWLSSVMRIIFLFATILSFSTTGIFTMPIVISYALFFDFNRQTNMNLTKDYLSFLLFKIIKNSGLLMSALLLLCAIGFLMNLNILDPNNSLFNEIFSDSNSLNVSRKMGSSATGISWTSRYSQLGNGWDNFWNHSWGIIGIGKVDFKAVNLISRLDEIGIQGLFCILIMYVNYITKGKEIMYDIFYFFSILPIFITALLTQPIISSPLVVLILMFSFVDLKNSNYYKYYFLKRIYLHKSNRTKLPK